MRCRRDKIEGWARIKFLVLKSVLVTTLITGFAYGESSVEQLLGQAGLQAQLELIGTDIIAETQRIRSTCPDDRALVNRLTELTARLYDWEDLIAISKQQISEQLEEYELRAVSDWYSSPTGKRVIAAEASLVHLTSEEINQREKRLVESAHWTPDRRALIAAVLKSTRTHHYFAALHNSLSVVAGLTGLCVLNDEFIAVQDRAYDTAANDETIAAMFILIELILPTGVIFDQLTDTELNALVAFADSDSGRRWHDVLISATRRAVLSAYPELRSWLLRNQK